MLPKLKLTKKDVESARAVEDLEILPLTIEKIMVDPEDGAVVILQSDDKLLGFPLNAIEGTLLSFVLSGLSDDSHIVTIPQLLLRFLGDQGTVVKSVTLESKVGDIIYASCAFQDRKHREFYAIVSIGDGLVLATLAGAKLGVVRRVRDAMDEFDDWPYQDSIGEYDIEDDDA